MRTRRIGRIIFLPRPVKNSVHIKAAQRVHPLPQKRVMPRKLYVPEEVEWRVPPLASVGKIAKLPKLMARLVIRARETDSRRCCGSRGRFVEESMTFARARAFSRSTPHCCTHIHTCWCSALFLLFSFFFSTYTAHRSFPRHVLIGDKLIELAL